MQTLIDFTDEEIAQFTEREHVRIKSLASDQSAMLRTLKADLSAEDPYCRALKLYPELLRDGYSRNTLKNIKKRLLFDAKSGKIRCQNKRLFVIPDFYAACQFWFLGETKPEGLLKPDEIACKAYRRLNKADVLRSPHLYQEHFICNISHDQRVYDWFTTNGVYTSVKSLISRVLQFDKHHCRIKTW